MLRLFSGSSWNAAGRLAVLVVTVVLIGGHWGVLQAVAWAGMLYDYSARYGVTEGIVKTFDGSQPCSLCHAVREGRQNEKKQPPALKLEKKIEMIVAAAPRAVGAPWPRDYSHPRGADALYSTRAERPPAPVPIGRPRLG